MRWLLVMALLCGGVAAADEPPTDGELVVGRAKHVAVVRVMGVTKTRVDLEVEEVLKGDGGRFETVWPGRAPRRGDTMIVVIVPGDPPRVPECCRFEYSEARKDWVRRTTRKIAAWDAERGGVDVDSVTFDRILERAEIVAVVTSRGSSWHGKTFAIDVRWDALLRGEAADADIVVTGAERKRWLELSPDEKPKKVIVFLEWEGDHLHLVRPSAILPATKANLARVKAEVTP